MKPGEQTTLSRIGKFLSICLLGLLSTFFILRVVVVPYTNCLAHAQAEYARNIALLRKDVCYSAEDSIDTGMTLICEKANEFVKMAPWIRAWLDWSKSSDGVASSFAGSSLFMIVGVLIAVVLLAIVLIKKSTHAVVTMLGKRGIADLGYTDEKFVLPTHAKSKYE